MRSKKKIGRLLTLFVLAALLIVRYDAAGKLMGMRQPTLDLSSGTQTIAAVFADAAASDTYKVFLFNGASYVPMNAVIEP